MNIMEYSIQTTSIPYTYKFSRDVNFAVFVGNLSSMKFKSSKIYKTVVIHLKYNKRSMKIKSLDLGNLRKLHPLKICTIKFVLYGISITCGIYMVHISFWSA